jgi:metal-dependent amidase/aminoacylase/carboxypeptidase family protein
MEQRLKAIGEAAPRRCEMCNRFPVNGVAQASGLTATVRPSLLPHRKSVTTAQVRLSSFDDACTENEEFVGELPGACTYPPMINNAAAWQLAKSVAATIVGAERVQEADATMGGEDFGYFMRHIPGVFVLIGSGSEPLGTTHGVHTPLFKLDESVLSTGAAMHVMFARAALEQLRQEQQQEL